jgi:hypothetical protein
MPNASGTSRYIIRAIDEGPALAEFIAGLHAHPQVRLQNTIGPRDRPHTAVVETDAATAANLGNAFRSANRLTIEPDQPLSLSSQDGHTRYERNRHA